jgi:hypothetical protein
MAGVNVDPDKLRTLGKELARIGSQIEDLTRNMQRKLDASGWNDNERQKFQQDISTVMKGLQQHAQRLNSQFVPTLNRKAAAIDQYRRG